MYGLSSLVKRQATGQATRREIQQKGSKGETAMNIQNKTILITGASRGIGRALLAEALKRGARTVYVAIRGGIYGTDERCG